MRLLMFMVIFLKLALTWTHYREWFVAWDLSYNSVTGPVPQLLSELPALEILNLTSNNLTGSVPKALMEKSSLLLICDSFSFLFH
ncbi:probable leucine-rich repeat receptor-like protein kinase At2g28990 [Camellia sinensis]|uniref:probable leucine-rich repeat receptor-like protein kinase At2g28990 n=1 Tax=Camellia sinensis TaxID=4442 RepID=UPI0010368BB6|nr:probable leucine-rich repeat receptor-like protein kinase At2g28990 [Camellia sinensis]